MYFAPVHPFVRSRSYLWRFRGADAGTLSGRQIIETRERDLEKYAKELLEKNGSTQLDPLPKVKLFTDTL